MNDPLDISRDAAVDAMIARAEDKSLEYPSINPLIDWTNNDSRELPIDQAHQAIMLYRRLRTDNAKMRAAMELFCQRRERGEIQSSTTYKQFKQILEGLPK